jgi:hypothetical protein
MDKTEMESLVKQLKAAGLDDEQIMETFFETFTEGKMDRADLEACAEFMGYELTDEFKNDKTPDPIAMPEGGLTKEAAEEAKEIKPGESEEEFKESIEAADDGKSEEGESAEDKPAEEESEDEEWEKAQKLFKF